MKKLLEQILKDTNWTAYRLGKIAGISKQTISNWHVKDSSSISFKHLAAIRKATGMSWTQIGKWIDEALEDERR